MSLRAPHSRASLTTVATIEQQANSPCRCRTLARLAEVLGEDPATTTLRPSPEKSDTRTGTLVEFDRTAKIFQDPRDSRTRAYVTGRMG